MGTGKTSWKWIWINLGPSLGCVGASRRARSRSRARYDARTCYKRRDEKNTIFIKVDGTRKGVDMDMKIETNRPSYSV